MPIGGYPTNPRGKIASFQSARRLTSTRSATSIGVLSALVLSGTIVIAVTACGGSMLLPEMIAITPTVGGSLKAIVAAVKTLHLRLSQADRTMDAEMKMLGGTPRLSREMTPTVDGSLKLIVVRAKILRVRLLQADRTTDAEMKFLSGTDRLSREMTPAVDGRLKLIVVGAKILGLRLSQADRTTDAQMKTLGVMNRSLFRGTTRIAAAATPETR